MSQSGTSEERRFNSSCGGMEAMEVDVSVHVTSEERRFISRDSA